MAVRAVAGRKMGPFFTALTGSQLADAETRAAALTTIRQARLTQLPEVLRKDTIEVRRILEECFDHVLQHLDDSEMIAQTMVPARQLIDHFLEDDVEEYSLTSFTALTKVAEDSAALKKELTGYLKGEDSASRVSADPSATKLLDMKQMTF